MKEGGLIDKLTNGKLRLVVAAEQLHEANTPNCKSSYIQIALLFCFEAV